METASLEKHGFQAEVKELLRLVAHSLYSNKEIVLRELVSNASDAADKLRFEALSDAALYEGDGDLSVRISVDRDARTLTVSDNGIGMSREEVIDHLGTIARSGTREFFSRLSGEAARDSQLIGQFGVGFYSSFIVADRVTVITRRAGLAPEHGVRWESDGQGEYTVETVAKPARGTDVVLHLRDGFDEFLDVWRLRQIVRRYSDHIFLPIRLPAEKAGEWETANQASALWARNKSEISEDQYREFYHHVSHDFEPPLAWTHHRVEGRQEYIQLLYLPNRAPLDLMDRDHAHGLKLYVRRVFIMDDAKSLLPPWLRFVRGVVDASDLPLNVSRELLQESRDAESIRAGNMRRVLNLLEDIAASDAEKYATFWREFGRVLKEGVAEDEEIRQRVAKLLRFPSTTTETGTSLADYVGRMKDGQKKIYYLTADSLAAAKASPHLEMFGKHGVEVLLLAEPVDEWVVNHITEFDDKPLQSAASAGLDVADLGAARDEDAERHAEEARPLLDAIKAALADRVADVRVSSRLVDSPACLVAEGFGITPRLARLLRDAGQPVPEVKPVLEVNLGHALVTRMDGMRGTERFDELSRHLLDQAVLAEGGTLEDPAVFIRRVNGLVVEALAANA